MRDLFDKLVHWDKKKELEGPVTVTFPASPDGDDHAIEVLELDTESYIRELCHLIARSGQNPVLRKSYEDQLNQITRHSKQPSAQAQILTQAAAL
ncbi:hypothetical protein [Deefgea rivuli]|uniref:hypothetical protein n=1 Tax=Deefgea rivuli TaxID=400948 RepID=UPI000481AA11|nr:hypothetical protein [Deefgea rivuli]